MPGICAMLVRNGSIHPRDAGHALICSIFSKCEYVCALVCGEEIYALLCHMPLHETQTIEDSWEREGIIVLFSCVCMCVRRGQL